MEAYKESRGDTLVRKKGSSPSEQRTPPPQEQTVCMGMCVCVLREDIGNFHITWGPVILSSMFPSGGKRESQGADNAEGDRNHDENGIPNSWQPKDYYTVSIPHHPVSALRTEH